MAEPETRNAPGKLLATVINSIKLATIHKGTQPHAPGHRLGSLGLVSAGRMNCGRGPAATLILEPPNLIDDSRKVFVHVPLRTSALDPQPSTSPFFS